MFRGVVGLLKFLGRDDEGGEVIPPENLQRDDLTAVEEIESIVKWIDARMGEDPTWEPWLRRTLKSRAGGQRLDFDLDKAIDRVTYFLSLCESDRKNSTTKVSQVYLANLEAAFDELNRDLKWRWFLDNDLPMIRSMAEPVKQAVIENDLNKSQAEALESGCVFSGPA